MMINRSVSGISSIRTYVPKASASKSGGQAVDKYLKGDIKYAKGQAPPDRKRPSLGPKAEMG
jgi:hypothetical protein